MDFTPPLPPYPYPPSSAAPLTLQFSDYVFPIWSFDAQRGTVADASLPVALCLLGLGGVAFWGIAAALFLEPPWIGLTTASISIALAAAAVLSLMRWPSACLPPFGLPHLGALTSPPR